MDTLAFWEKYLQWYDALNLHRAYVQYLDELANIVVECGAERILDAGSGTGNLALRLKAKGVQVVGLDFAYTALKINREKDRGTLLVRASLEHTLPFRSRSFDCVVCASVLFTISKPGGCQAMSEFRRVLKPGGRLVLTAMKPGQSKLKYACEHIASRFRAQPFKEFMSELAGSFLLMGRMLYYNLRMHRLGSGRYYRRFSGQELRETFLRAGFLVLRQRTVFHGRFNCIEGVSRGPPQFAGTDIPGLDKRQARHQHSAFFDPQSGSCGSGVAKHP